MKMDKVAGSGNDEFYTPKYAVDAIIEYLKPNSKVWCPFDTEDSYFVKILKSRGFNVIFTHLDNGIDFFNTETPYDIDYIISNPPYSLKNEVLGDLFSRKIPFAMLLGVVGIFESQFRFNLFKENNFEIMYMNKRVAYFQDYSEVKPSKSPPFSSVYITQDILPDRIVFQEVDNKDYHFHVDKQTYVEY